MVHQLTFYKKRQYLDFNDINFVTNLPSTGVNPYGLPIFPEIDDDQFNTSTFSTDHYMKLSTTDNYGFFTNLYARSGARKLTQSNVELIMKSPANNFNNPVVFTTFVAARPVLYDPRGYVESIPDGPLDKINDPIPLQNFFNIIPTNVMRCSNYHKEFRSNHVNSPSSILESVFAIPPAISFTDGDMHHKHVLDDLPLHSAFRTVGSIVKGNEVHTIHNLMESFELSLPDTANFPEGVHLEFKTHYYLYRIQYPVQEFGAGKQNLPQLVPIDAEQVLSFSGAQTIT